jgi:TonB family protein
VAAVPRRNLCRRRPASRTSHGVIPPCSKSPCIDTIPFCRLPPASQRQSADRQLATGDTPASQPSTPPQDDAQEPDSRETSTTTPALAVRERGISRLPQLSGEDLEKFAQLLLLFVLRRSGQVSRVELVRSSGSKVLDKEAWEAVLNPSPLDPFPPQIPEDESHIRARFTYVLEAASQRTRLH